MKTSLVVLFATTALFACGGKKEGKFNEAQAKQTATSNIDTAVTLNASTSDTAGETGAQQFQTTAQAASASTITPTAMRLLPLMLGNSGRYAAGTRECSNKKCTFQDYTKDSDGSTVTINGAIDWSTGHVKTGPDLTFKLKTSGLDWSTTLKVDLTLTETSINGTIVSTGKGTVEGTGSFVAVGGGWEYTSNIEYKSVTLAAGKPNGGSVVVSGDYTVGGQTYSGSGTVSYP